MCRTLYTNNLISAQWSLHSFLYRGQFFCFGGHGWSSYHHMFTFLMCSSHHQFSSASQEVSQVIWSHIIQVELKSSMFKSSCMKRFERGVMEAGTAVTQQRRRPVTPTVRHLHCSKKSLPRTFNCHSQLVSIETNSPVSFFMYAGFWKTRHVSPEISHVKNKKISLYPNLSLEKVPSSE